MRALILASIVLVAACGEAAPPPTSAPPANPPHAAPTAAHTAGSTDVAGLKAVMDAGPISLIDVRTPGEFAGGHAPGAVNVPLNELEGRISELEATKAGDVYLICAVGGRSIQATKLLEAKGWAHPINVEGGTNAWKAAGYPVE